MRCSLCELCWGQMGADVHLDDCESGIFGGDLLAWGDFDGVLRTAIHALKFQGRPSLGRELGRRMAEAMKCQLVSLDGLVPMPLHAARLRERGYNQSMEIALGFAEVLCIPVLSGWVERKKNTQQQANLCAERRWDNMLGAFVWHRQMVPGQVLGIVDDVVTTGATMMACMSAYPGADRRRLQPVVLARA